MAAVAGILLSSRTNSVSPSTGGQLTLLFAVGAAVIGGVSLFGGKGRVVDAVVEKKDGGNGVSRPLVPVNEDMASGDGEGVRRRRHGRWFSFRRVPYEPDRCCSNPIGAPTAVKIAKDILK